MNDSPTIGQTYKTRVNGEWVAVRVEGLQRKQRPDRTYREGWRCRRVGVGHLKTMFRTTRQLHTLREDAA